MEVYTRIRILTRGFAVLLAAAVCFAVCALLCGCSSGGGISLDRDGITLFVGELRDIFPYVRFMPSTVADKALTVTSDGECVTIDGTSLRAVECGQARITVSGNGGSAELKVTVLTRSPQSLELSVVGDLDISVEDVKSAGTVELTATIDGLVSPELEAEWKVDGVAVASGSAFTYVPSGCGEYEISVTAAGLTATCVVRIYRPTETTVTCIGALEQNGVFAKVTYIAEQAVNFDNPRSVYEWKINGKTVCSSPVLEFTPNAAGAYEVSLAVNGAKVALPKDIATVNAYGPRLPACDIAFDDEDGVYVQWDDCDGVFRVSIKSPDGKRRVADISDAQYSYLFEKNRFDASDYIDVCADVPGEYEIAVYAEGKSELTFAQYPREAAAYLAEKPFYKNTFVTSDADGCELIDDIYASGLTEADCYIAHGAATAVEAMRSYAQALGLTVSVAMNGDVARFGFAWYVNAPTRFDELPKTPEIRRMYTELPHIEYDGAKRRASSYVFAIDKIKRGVSVNNSEQLVTAVLRGLRPEPQDGTAAEYVYSTVRARLLGIIGARYTAAQKVHAMYDWLQWVTVGVQTADETSASNYAESVFGTSALQGGDARRATVTSAGAAKAFALMCGVEGIECIIQSSNIDGAPHFSNKVKIDGLWYNVDVLRGKATSAEVGVQSAVQQVQLCTHRALLINDAAAAALGLATAGGEYRAFDAELSVYCEKTKEDGRYVDKHISSADAENEDAVRAAVFYAFSACALGSVSVPVIAGIETYMNTTLGVEMEVDADADSVAVQKICELLTHAADEYAKSVFGKSFAPSAVRIYRIQNKIHLVASAAGMSA